MCLGASHQVTSRNVSMFYLAFCSGRWRSKCNILWAHPRIRVQTLRQRPDPDADSLWDFEIHWFRWFSCFFPPLCRPCLFCQPVVRQQQCLTKMVTSTGAGWGVHMFAPNIPSNGSMEVSYKIIGFNIILKWSNDLDGLGAPVNLGNLHINVRHAIEDKIN